MNARRVAARASSSWALNISPATFLAVSGLWLTSLVGVPAEAVFHDDGENGGEGDGQHQPAEFRGPERAGQQHHDQDVGQGLQGIGHGGVERVLD